MRRILARAVVSAALCAACCPTASGQSSGPEAGAGGSRPAGQAAAAVARAGAAGEKKLTAAEERLVEGSRAAVLATGLSAAYFDAHFKLVKVFDTAGDRRVVWKYTVAEHEATLSDSVGFYTDAGGRRVDVHSVSSLLSSTHEIRKTISRSRARRIMKSCIGEFTGGSVTYQRHGVSGRAALVFTAVSLPPPEQAGVNAAAPSPSSPPNPSGQAEGGPPRDTLRRKGGKKKPFLSIGSVDLETGRCIKGVAQVGSPQPPPAKQPRP